MTSVPTRSHETEIEIQASPEDVWKALTDPIELARWFPRQADVDPGVGGSLRLHWGPTITGICPIQVWEPAHHLRTGWVMAEGGAATRRRSR